MIRHHVRPRLGVHIANSDECVIAVLPTPRTPLTDTSVRHALRRDGMGRHDQLMTSEHGTSGEQEPNMELSLSPSTVLVGPI